MYVHAQMYAVIKQLSVATPMFHFDVYKSTESGGMCKLNPVQLNA